MTGKAGLTRDGRRGLAREGIGVLLHLTMLLLAAGTVRWPMAWLYGGWLMTTFVLRSVVLSRLNPDLLNRRGRTQAGAEKSDIVILITIFILFYVIFIVSGLNHRFAPPAPAWWPGLGWPLAVLASALILWSMTANTHFEGLIRIQTDRGHAVCDTGPYRLVRHPGYVGMICGVMAPPLVLQSWWGLIPAGAAAGLFIARTALEDAALKRELEGYQDFAARTRYRLFPGIW